MPLLHALRRALPVAALALAMTAAPGLTWAPSVVVHPGAPGEVMALTDLATHGNDLAASATLTIGSTPKVLLNVSNDGGATWQPYTTGSAFAVREPRVTICAGQAVMIYRFDVDDPPTQWVVESQTTDLTTNVSTSETWMQNGVYRTPDVACVANDHMVGAMFRKMSGSWHVHVMSEGMDGSGPHHPNDLGSGTPGRGLSIASSSSRVYVTWFEGSKLKLRRYAISSSSDHHLTSLGTSTVATLSKGSSPRIGADGDTVILAYMDKASLKVRRSTNQGGSFGPARTLRSEGYPGESGAYPNNVTVKGSKVAIGGVEINQSSPKGLGYLSTDGGTSYAKVSQHSTGNLVAGMVRVTGHDKYVELWDQSFFSNTDPEVIQYRRQ